MALAWVFAIAEAALREMLLFAGVCFLIGSLDEIACDLGWLWCKLRGKLTISPALPPADQQAAVAPVAVFIPAWQEDAVIAQTLQHCLAVWPQASLRLYVGCYRNDPATRHAIAAAGLDDPRLITVDHAADGPTSKADCLNALWRAMLADEAQGAARIAHILLHDAEDIVHPMALVAMDRQLQSGADFVQIPVEPLLDAQSPWIAGHYADEFAEAHAKVMPLRAALGAAMPAAGVGCGFSRGLLERIADQRGRDRNAQSGPFAHDCLTEDYELGLLAAQAGGRSLFLRQLAPDGGIIATRAYFPADRDAAVRQKTRWVLGIALQGWDRLGWRCGPVDMWMRLRDRRGPLTAIVLTLAYGSILLWGMLWAAQLAGWHDPRQPGPLLSALLIANLFGFGWRAIMRMGFTTARYGWQQGLLALPRIFVGNIIAIMSGWRALLRYGRSLAGRAPAWDKTSHRWPDGAPPHPAAANPAFAKHAR